MYRDGVNIAGHFWSITEKAPKEDDMDLTTETIRMQLLEMARHLQPGDKPDALVKTPARPTAEEMIEVAKVLEKWVIENNR